MQIKFVAGFGPLVRDPAASLAFYRDTLGLPLHGEGYVFADELEGVRHFGQWSVADAAHAMFGTDEWPADVPLPQANIEFDVGAEEDLAEAARQLQDAGYPPLVGPKKEPWGQSVVRLLGPEGLLISITYTPSMHGSAANGSSRGRRLR
jgi:catechol 2,3-dioxygenase-like lactoylglutathione lyase family enzyme